MLLLLRRDAIFLFFAFTLPCNRKALSDGHIRLGLSHEGIADILLGAALPAIVVLLAEGPNGPVSLAAHVFGGDGRRLRGDVVNVHFELFAVGFERQVVDVVAKGVFDFAANGGESDAERVVRFRSSGIGVS